jgi:hypothetical protein
VAYAQSKRPRGESERRIVHVPLINNVLYRKECLRTLPTHKLVYVGGVWALGIASTTLQDYCRGFVSRHTPNAGLRGYYIYVLDYAGKGINQTLRIIANEATHPILMHCHQGKDRTGIVGTSLTEPLVLCHSLISSLSQLP